MSRVRGTNSRSVRRETESAVPSRLAVLVPACTVALTLAFVGLFALATGAAGNPGSRVPFYVLGTSMAFVAALLAVDGPRREGPTVLAIAGGVAAATFLTLSLGAEGLLYAVRHPDAVLITRDGLYLIAAGLIATGVGYWVSRHWRELAAGVRSV